MFHLKLAPIFEYTANIGYISAMTSCIICGIAVTVVIRNFHKQNFFL